MVNTEIWMGAHQALTFVPESELFLGYSRSVLTAAATLSSDSGKTHLYDLDLDADLDATSGASTGTKFSDRYSMVTDIYAGCLVDFYTNGGTFVQTLMVHSNSYKSLYFADAWDDATLDADAYAIIRKYGAAVPGPIKTDTSGSTEQSTLLSDNWLGLVSTATFPNVEVEMKPMNLGLGGQTRNMTFQMKGLETATGGSLDIQANHGAWLYYALGRCTNINAQFNDTSSIVTDEYTAASGAAMFLMESGADGSNAAGVGKFNEQGPFFYRRLLNQVALCPPLAKNQLGETNDMEQLIIPTMSSGAITNPITYTFKESDTSLLPSFTLEISNSKSNPAGDDLQTDGGDEVFTRIATGNMVNSLTLSANENEALTMSLDLNTKMVIEPQGAESDSSGVGQAHFAHRGVTDERDFVNFGSSLGTAALLEQDFLNPFHFYDGSISLLGTQYLKITSMQLTINNNLQDKRYVGNYNKKIKTAVPGNRDYELTFSGYVTDKAIFTALLNESETTVDTSQIDLNFQKDNGEQIQIKFDDYYVTSNTWTIPEEKGPIQVDWTIVPRTLTSCTVKSHWVLQG
tara:strand:- start:1149 stop:2867 length:1719 start_codon:yes stop_codon:yes gene_type:complete